MTDTGLEVIAAGNPRRLPFESEAGRQQHVLDWRRREEPVVCKVQQRAAPVERVCKIDPGAEGVTACHRAVLVVSKTKIGGEVLEWSDLVLKVGANLPT